MCWRNAKLRMAARRSPFSKSPRPPRCSPFRGIRRMCSFWKWGWAGAWMPPTSSAARRHSRRDWAKEVGIEQGLRRVDWPARLQRLTRGPLIALAPERAEVWLDGGHNPHAAHAIAQALADFEEKSEKPLYLICGMLK